MIFERNIGHYGKAEEFMKKYGMLAGLLLLCTLFAACGAGKRRRAAGGEWRRAWTT